MEEKRVRVRAIIIYNGQLALMYRQRGDRCFYTFPGGGIEDNETKEECVIREVYEEFGIIVKPIKKVYIYKNQISIEHFYITDWVSGEFGTGHGEEYQENNNNGIYVPKFIEISDIPKLPLMPPEVASFFYNDYLKNGKTLRDTVELIDGEIK